MLSGPGNFVTFELFSIFNIVSSLKSGSSDGKWRGLDSEFY